MKKSKNENLNFDYALLKNNSISTQKLLIQLKGQNSVLVKGYKNKELELKSKIEKIERKILINNKLLHETNNHNDMVKLQKSEIDNHKQEIKELKEKNQNLEKTIDDLKLNINNNQNVSINDLKNKIKYYQEENIRISSELIESNKKFEITKESLNELQNHRSGLIEKINSINEVIKNENIVTSVFRSDLEENKIKVINNSKPTKNDKIDLNEEIKNIFSKN